MDSCVTEVQLRELEWKTQTREYMFMCTACDISVATFATLSKYRKPWVTSLAISVGFNLSFSCSKQRGREFPTLQKGNHPPHQGLFCSFGFGLAWPGLTWDSSSPVSRCGSCDRGSLDRPRLPWGCRMSLWHLSSSSFLCTVPLFLFSISQSLSPPPLCPFYYLPIVSPSQPLHPMLSSVPSASFIAADIMNSSSCVLSKEAYNSASSVRWCRGRGGFPFIAWPHNLQYILQTEDSFIWRHWANSFSVIFRVVFLMDKCSPFSFYFFQRHSRGLNALMNDGEWDMFMLLKRLLRITATPSYKEKDHHQSFYQKNTQGFRASLSMMLREGISDILKGDCKAIMPNDSPSFLLFFSLVSFTWIFKHHSVFFLL